MDAKFLCLSLGSLARCSTSRITLVRYKACFGSCWVSWSCPCCSSAAEERRSARRLSTAAHRRATTVATCRMAAAHGNLPPVTGAQTASRRRVVGCSSRCPSAAHLRPVARRFRAPRQSCTIRSPPPQPPARAPAVNRRARPARSASRARPRAAGTGRTQPTSLPAAARTARPCAASPTAWARAPQTSSGAPARLSRRRPLPRRAGVELPPCARPGLACRLLLRRTRGSPFAWRQRVIWHARGLPGPTATSSTPTSATREAALHAHAERPRDRHAVAPS